MPFPAEPSAAFYWVVSIARLIAAVTVALPGYVLAMVVGLVSRTMGLRIGIRSSRLLLAVAGVRIVVQQNALQENPRGCVFILLNHTSLLDPHIASVITPMPYRAITAVEYASLPIFGWATWVFGWVLIRQWPAQAKKTLNKAVSFIRDGGNVIVAIEGRFSRDGSLSAYKKGPAVLAIQSGATIVPIFFHGVRARMPYGAWRARPGTVTVSFLEPIPTAGMDYADRDALVARLRQCAEREVCRSESGSWAAPVVEVRGG